MIGQFNLLVGIKSMISYVHNYNPTQDTYWNLRRNIYNFWSKNKQHFLGNVLEIGPSQRYNFKIPEFFPDVRKSVEENNAKYSSLDRAGDNTFNCDLLELKTQQTFDTIVALECFEHTAEIWKVPAKLHDLLNDQGKIYVSTPYLFRYHGPFPDYWRISPDGYLYLFKNLFDLKIICYSMNTDYEILNVCVEGVKK